MGLALIIYWTSSCRNDFEYGPSTGRLEFSRDTVFLDTVFTNIGSATYTLKVYNLGRDDILIPSIALEAGESSSYRLNVDGEAGKSFTNVPLLALDSLFIFVETTFNISPVSGDPFLYTDAIVFDSGPREQKVPLVTLVRDAVFLYPARLPNGSRETLVLGPDEDGNPIEVPGFELSDAQLDLNADKPYVIYGYAGVPSGKSLRIQAGARLHFHKDSGLFVAAAASLNIEGELSEDLQQLEKEVIFEGDRLEAAFEDIPGQWEGIWLAEGSTGHRINYLSLRNATIGIYLVGNGAASEPVLHISNSRIGNSATSNLLARNTHLLGENLVLGNAGFASLLCELAGNYTFRHCTIGNFWSQGGRTGPALILRNTAGGTDRLQSVFTNCIVTGNSIRELGLQGSESNLQYLFSHTLLRYEATGGVGPDLGDTEKFVELLLNGEAGFLNPARQDFRLGSNSEAVGKGDPNTALTVPFDLLGTDRRASPDLGAYQANF